MGDDALLGFAETMRRLQRECPWKREQTHRSLARYLQEEAYETLEAIDAGDDDHLREELGDLLLQVYFHATIAEAEGAFTLGDVAAGVDAKMHRRNPHVFGPDPSSSLTAAEVDALYHAEKAAERHRSSPYDGVPAALPALLLATKLLERSGSDVSLPDPGDTAAPLGMRLLALAAEAHATGTDPEQALRDAVRRTLP